MKKTAFSFRIDTRWCLDELLKEGRISQRDANLVATTPRTRDKLHWHPLQMIAQFGFADVKKPDAKLDLDILTAWLAEKAGQPLYHIDPLKINAAVKDIINPAIVKQYGDDMYMVKQVVGIDTSELFVAKTGVQIRPMTSWVVWC